MGLISRVSSRTYSFRQIKNKKMSSDNEPTPSKQQKLNSTSPQKTALELLAEITSEKSIDSEDTKNIHGLDLHGKTIEEMDELLKLENLSKNQYKKIIRYKTY